MTELNSERSDDAFIEVENLTLQFEGYEGVSNVLDGIDMTINKGEAVGLVGETGCGKSVTANSILGTLPMPPGKIPKGSIKFQGNDLLELPGEKADQHRRSSMGLIPQNPMTGLNPVFTIGEQLRDVYQYRGQKRVGLLSYLTDTLKNKKSAQETVIDMLEEVELPGPENVFDSYPVELSGGMRQRVLIAEALLGDPSFIVADEPGTALDVTIQAQILELLRKEIDENDLTVLYITHNLGVAKQLTETIYVMYAGQIAEKSPTGRLFKEPKHPYTQELLKSVPRLGKEMDDGIEGSIPDFVDPPTGCRFHPRCPHAVDGVCDVEEPPPIEVADDHQVACHLYRDDIDEEPPTPDVVVSGDEESENSEMTAESIASKNPGDETND